jgi:hypothetical protein
MKSLELWYLPYPDKMMPCHLWQSLLLLSSSSASRINRKASSMYVFLASFGVEAASAIHVAAQRHFGTHRSQPPKFQVPSLRTREVVSSTSGPPNHIHILVVSHSEVFGLLVRVFWGVFGLELVHFVWGTNSHQRSLPERGSTAEQHPTQFGNFKNVCGFMAVHKGPAKQGSKRYTSHCGGEMRTTGGFHRSACEAMRAT